MSNRKPEQHIENGPSEGGSQESSWTVLPIGVKQDLMDQVTEAVAASGKSRSEWGRARLIEAMRLHGEYVDRRSGDDRRVA